MARFQDKVVVVTGGAMGIGEAACEAFAKQGAKVVIADCNDLGQGVSDRLNAQGFDTIYVETDVTKEEQVINLVNKTVEKYKKIDVMCANAGIGHYATPIDHTGDDFDRILDVNLKGAFYCNKYAAIEMLKQGKGAIVNTASIGSYTGRPSQAAYCASKGGIKLLTQTMSRAYCAQGIRVNAVAPGVILTPLIEFLTQTPEHRQQMVDLHPIGRLGTPMEVANAMVFLASDEASFVTGAILPVDGGYTS